MNARAAARNVPGRPLFDTDWRSVRLALLAVALLIVAIGLAVIGLDLLNDLLARGFTSVGSRSG